MDAAFERAERGLEFAMANGYREEIEKKRKTCDGCKLSDQKGRPCETCGTPGAVSDVNKLTLEEVWDGLDRMSSRSQIKLFLIEIVKFGL